VHRAVPEHLLHPEHIHPRVRQREPNLNLAAVLLAQLTEVVASHRRLDPYLAHPPHQTHVTPHLQRQLVVAPGPSPVAHDLDQEVVGHVLTLEEVTPAELLLLDHVLVELEDLRADPLLRLDGDDVVAADYFLAVAQAVVHADLDGGRGGVEEADEEDAGAAAVGEDAAVEV